MRLAASRPARRKDDRTQLTGGGGCVIGGGMATGLSTLRLRARAIALVAALLYLLPFVLQASLAGANPRDTAFEAAVRAGIVCSASAPAQTAPASDQSRGSHPAGVCIVCLSGCPLAGAALPTDAVAAMPARPAFRDVALGVVDAGQGLGRPRSDIGARAPPFA
jgi:hypothetical protein